MKVAQISYQTLFTNLPGLNLILSRELTILDLTDSYALATMVRREEVIGKGIFEVFPANPDSPNDDGPSALKKSLEFVLKTKKTHRMGVVKYDIPKGNGTFEVRYWSPLNKPVLNEENEIVCIVHKVEDVTEFINIELENKRGAELTKALHDTVHEMEIEIVKRSNEVQHLNQSLESEVERRTEKIERNKKELLAKNEELARQNKELAQFAYITSHDLQEPLRSLLSLVEHLEEDLGNDLSDQSRLYLQYIVESANRLKELVKGLLDYSRIGKDKQIEWAECNAILRDVLADLALVIHESTNIAIISDPLPKIKCYPVEIRLLFQNLIANSIKFRKSHGKTVIKISAKKTNGAWQFSVQDNGIGFENESSESIFMIFKRLHNQNEYPGTGIGLAHCKKIVELHNGKIWSKSEPGVGSTFFFTIPII